MAGRLFLIEQLFEGWPALDGLADGVAHCLVVVELDALAVSGGRVDEDVGDHGQVVQGSLGKAAILDAGRNCQIDAARGVVVDVAGLLLGSHGHSGNQQGARPLVDDAQFMRRPRLVQCSGDGSSDWALPDTQQQVDVSQLEEGRSREPLADTQGEVLNLDFVL